MVNEEEVLECFKDKANRKILWQTEKPQSVNRGRETIDGRNRFYSLTDNIAVSMIVGEKPDLGFVHTVLGDKQTNYRFEALDTYNGKSMAFDPNNSFMAVKKNSFSANDLIRGIALYQMEGVDENGDGTEDFEEVKTGSLINIPGAENYTKLKFDEIKNRFLFGARFQDLQNQGMIWEVPDSINVELAQLVQLSFWDTTMNPGWGFLETSAFDLDGIYTITAFTIKHKTTGEEQLKIGMGIIGMMGAIEPQEITITPPADAALLSDIRSIQIYKRNSAADNDGHALMLDSERGRLGFLTYNHHLGNINLSDAWIQLPALRQPNSFVLSPRKTTAYVINKGQDSLSIIHLFDANNKPLSADQITITDVPLSQFMPGKNIKLRPNSIMYQDLKGDEDYLVIGLEDLKSVMVVGVQGLTLEK